MQRDILALIAMYLFAMYVDELITQLRQCGYGLHIGQLFVRCALLLLHVMVYTD